MVYLYVYNLISDLNHNGPGHEIRCDITEYNRGVNLLDRAKLKDSSVVNNSENLLWVNILEKAKNSIFPDIERIKEDDENTAIHDLHTEVSRLYNTWFDAKVAKENAAAVAKANAELEKAEKEGNDAVITAARGKLQAAQAAKAAAEEEAAAFAKAKENAAAVANAKAELEKAEKKGNATAITAARGKLQAAEAAADSASAAADSASAAAKTAEEAAAAASAAAKKAEEEAAAASAAANETDDDTEGILGGKKHKKTKKRIKKNNKRKKTKRKKTKGKKTRRKKTKGKKTRRH